MVVVEKLAAELEVELAAELPDALTDLLRLEGDVLVVVKPMRMGLLSSVSTIGKGSTRTARFQQQLRR